MTGTEETMSCPLHQAALRDPDSPAIVRDGATISYKKLDRLVSAASERLAGLGLERGARVALYLPKTEHYVVLLLALLRAGAVSCPISTRLPLDGVAAVLGRAGCEALISDAESLDSLDPETRRLSLKDVLTGENDAPRFALRSPGPLVLDRVATVVFTSGSTSTPKAAMHTFGNHYYSALGSNANIPLAPGDRWMHSLPLYHVGGLSVIFRCALAGATIVLPDSRSSLGEAIVDSGATHVSLVATQLRRLLEEGIPAGHLKAVLMGGGPTPGDLVDEAVSRGFPIHTSYGLTEMASQVTTTPPQAPPGELHTSGHTLPHREVSIAEDGEILVRGKTLFAGYIAGGETIRLVDDDGWFHTKDLGEFTVDGLHVRGRKDNLFISGGENIQPEEVEEALLRLPGVEEAAVVPVPDAEFGARPVAFVRSASANVPADLRKELERVLPRFKVPKVFHVWPENAPEDMKVNRKFFHERALRLSNESP